MLEKIPAKEKFTCQLPAISLIMTLLYDFFFQHFTNINYVISLFFVPDVLKHQKHTITMWIIRCSEKMVFLKIAALKVAN